MPRIATILAIGLTAVALLFTTYELIEGRKLGRQLMLLRQSTLTERGLPLPSLVGSAPDGSVITIPSASGRRKLILVFSPQCGSCDENWPRWRALLDSGLGASTDPVFVSLGALDSEYIHIHRIPEKDVIARLSRESARDYSFQVTPMTVLLNDHGLVEGAWEGALNEPTVRLISGLIRSR